MQLEDVLTKLKNKGYKNTPQRRAVIETLVGMEYRPTAKEVWSEVHKAYPDISLDTVYRNLYLLVELGIVNQLNLRFKESSRFELSSSLHHHHLICLGCGKALCIDSCPISSEALAQAEKNNDFKIVDHAFEIYGYCSGCRKTG